MRVPATLGAYLSPAELLQSDAWASATIEGASLELMRVSCQIQALSASARNLKRSDIKGQPPTDIELGGVTQASCQMAPQTPASG